MFNINGFSGLRFFLSIILSFVWLLNPAIGQKTSPNYIDSLKSTTQNNLLSPQEKIIAYIDLAKYYLNTDLDSTAHYAYKAQNLSTEINYKKGLAVSTLQLAQIELTKGNYDQALPLFNKTLQLYEGLEKDVDFLQTLNSTGIIYEVRQDYDQALDFYLTGLRESELQDNKISIAFFHNNISIIYGYTGFHEKELSHIKKASKLFEELGYANYYANSLQNIGLYFKSVNEQDSAFYYFAKAEELQKKTNNYYGLTNLYSNLGDIYLDMGNMSLALNYYQKSLNTATLLDSLNPDREMEISAANNNLGNVFLKLGKFSVARDYFYKVYASGRFTKSLLHQKKGSYGLFSSYLGIDQRDSAMYYHKIFLDLNDSLLAEVYNVKIDKLNYEYELEKEKELFEKDKELITIQKNKQELIYLIIVGILFTIAFIIFIIWYFQKTKLQKSELRRENLRLEKENISNVLDKKNRELTTNVLNLIERNEFIAKLSERLQNHVNLKDSSNPEKIEDIIRSIDQDTVNNLWQEFEMRYMEVHKGFHQKLTANYPQLTANERKLCAFLVLNMSTKDISSITYQSEHSIKIARYRLRKKLGLHKNENLTSFLHNL